MTTTQSDIDEMIYYAQLASFAYTTNEQDLRNLLAGFGLDLVAQVHDAHTSTDAFMASDPHNPGRLIIAFKGTDDARDAMDDCDAWSMDMPIMGPKVRIHCGFRDCWAAVRQQILDYVRAHRVPLVITTGHSLGGALASICSVELTMYTDARVRERTFGSPRVGNMAWAALHGSRVSSTMRCVNDEDLVPKVPWFPYWHVGTLHRLRPSGVVESAGGPIRHIWRWINMMEYATKEDLDGDLIRDHMIDSYLLALKNARAA